MAFNASAHVSKCSCCRPRCTCSCSAPPCSTPKGAPTPTPMAAAASTTTTTTTTTLFLNARHDSCFFFNVDDDDDDDNVDLHLRAFCNKENLSMLGAQLVPALSWLNETMVWQRAANFGLFAKYFGSVRYCGCGKIGKRLR